MYKNNTVNNSHKTTFAVGE